MESDLITVLIPAYNVAKYLDRCLRSVLRQTYHNLEIVIVDDGSTDNTYAIAQKYAAQDSRIVLLQKVNEGNVAKTRNFLLAQIHGKYFVWVDSDDTLHPRYVEKLHQTLTSNGADMSVCRYALRVFALPTLPLLNHQIRTYNATDFYARMIFKTGFMLWNKMYRTDLLRADESVRFDTTLGFGEDLMFNLAYLRNCQKVACINQKLYRYSWRAGSEMHQKFSDKHISFVERLLAFCTTETQAAIYEPLRAWASFSCCGFVYLADHKRYFDVVQQMKHYAYAYRNNLYKNQLAKLGLKFILWLGLLTWCRPHNP